MWKYTGVCVNAKVWGCLDSIATLKRGKKEMKDKYVKCIYSPVKSFGNKPDFVDDTQIEPYQATGFTSLYLVSKETSEAIIQEGTTKHFKGVVWSQRLWLDIDSYEEADEVEQRLIEMEVDYVAFDSGGRGAHFGILRDHAPSHLLPQKDRAWVKANFPEADTSIYTHLHLFRLPQTVHEKTGRKKTLVSERRGRSITLPAYNDSSGSLADHGTGLKKSVFECFRVMSHTVPADTGSRHEYLVKLTYALKDDAGVSPKEALFWLKHTNLLYSEPKSGEDLEKIIRSIYG